MYRSLIALVIASAIAITGVVKPAYAYSSDSGVMPPNSHLKITGNSNSVNISDSFNGNNRETETNDPFWSFTQALLNGAALTLGGAIGGAIACYTIDGVATTIFPPAVALAAFCPAIGATSGSATAVAEGVKAVAGAY